MIIHLKKMYKLTPISLIYNMDNIRMDNVFVSKFDHDH